jgi:transposase
MPEGMRWVGLDVHAHETACAVLDGTTGEVESRKFRGRPQQLLAWLEGLERPFRAVYEARPTGYGLARRARERDLELEVCAPGHIARRPGDRVETDKRDALRLARLLAAGELTLVTVPPEQHEWLRDLVRCREDVRADLMRARHRLAKFLLRRELHYPGTGRGRGGANWSRRHRDWLAALRFRDRPSELVFADYLHAHDVLLARREGLDRALSELAGESPWAALIARLRCLRGIDTLTALGLCAEVSDWRRFRTPDALAAYLGLVPCENSSGERRRQGSITKAGSGHARRLLVEAAHHYSRPPRVSGTLRQRQQGQEPWVVELAWRCQRRLYGRWQRLRAERGKRSGIVAIAVARELAGFCWELCVTD